MMKSSKINIKIWIFFFAFLFAGLSFYEFTPRSEAYADSFSTVSVSDSHFTMQMSSTGRNHNVALPQNQQQVNVNIGTETLTYTFYCFQWRDIEFLTFNFSSNISGSANDYKSYQFKLTYVESENLSSSFGNGKEKILTQDSIIDNSFTNFDFYYYLDSDSNEYESSTRAKGYDFGLYKFDFCYQYSDGDTENIEKSIGEIYVAILPDDINSINHESDLQILYSVSSSNKLMNVYNLYLSTDDYKYANPKYLEWIIIGTDKEKTSYVYSEKMRQENIMYANYKAIWPTAQVEPYGNSFVFDSNDIEGEWTAICIIKDTEGNETSRLTVEGLSTIKKPNKSYVWLILTIVLSVLLLGGIVALVIFYLKREKIW